MAAIIRQATKMEVIYGKSVMNSAPAKEQQLQASRAGQ
jgi:hypothetical protein